MVDTAINQDVLEYTIRDAGFGLSLEKAVKESGKKYYRATYAQPSKEVRFFKLDKANANPAKNNDGYSEITHEQAYKDCGYIVEYVVDLPVQAENTALLADNQLVGQVDQQDNKEPTIAQQDKSEPTVASDSSVQQIADQAKTTQRVAATSDTIDVYTSDTLNNTSNYIDKDNIIAELEQIIECQKNNYLELQIDKSAVDIECGTLEDRLKSVNEYHDNYMRSLIDKLDLSCETTDKQLEAFIKSFKNEYDELIANQKNTDWLVEQLINKGYLVKLVKDSV